MPRAITGWQNVCTSKACTSSLQLATRGCAPNCCFTWAGWQDAMGFTPWMLAIPAALEAYQQISARVDKQSWKEASAAGRALSEEQAIALAYRLREISPKSGG